MKREERLRTQADFNRVFSRGKSFANRLAVLYVLPGDESCSRVGFVVSKRLGNAVTRNRLKRRYREAVRSLWPCISGGTVVHDLIVLPRNAGKAAHFMEIQKALIELGRQAGLSCDGES